jgi:hypothetical protein
MKWHHEFRHLRTDRRALRRRRHLRTWTVESMEERTLLSAFWVTNTGDNGGVNPAPGAGTATLRQAIIDANADTANTAADTIDFNIPGSGVQTIQPLSQLPIITHPVVIDGYSQQGSWANDMAMSDDAHLLIQLDGSLAGGAAGIEITAGNSEVMGLVVSNFQSSGIILAGTGGDVIEGNFLGTDPTGQYAAGNSDGVAIQFPCGGNRIGGDGSGSTDIPGGTSGYAARNLISANNGAGIRVGADNNVVAGNFVGTDVTGTKPLGNVQQGVLVIGIKNRIGVCGQDLDPSAERNLISGNGDGIDIEHGGQNVVAGNFIGTDVTGKRPLGNSGIGVDIFQSNGNLIGTNGDGVGDTLERNIISANQYDGMDIGQGSNNNVVAGNLIGTDVTGTRPQGNTRAGINVNYSSSGNTIGAPNVLNADGTVKVLRGNVISCNGGQIDLGSGAPGQGNLIAGNFVGTDINGNLIPGFTTGSGIDVLGDSNDQIGGSPTLANTIAGNNHGVAVSGPSTGISIRANRIFDNAPGLGIDLGSDGVTLNNSHAGQPGPNNWQNFPVLSTAIAGAATEIVATLNSTANTSFTIDFYANDPDKGNGGAHGPGQHYLGSATVTTDAIGNAVIDPSTYVAPLAATTPGEWVSATATDPAGNTSEFSLDEKVKAASTTTLTASATSPVYGQSLTFTANVAAVAPGAGTPTGSVQFEIDGADFGTAVELVNGSAMSAAIDTLGAGTHSITAVYSGDPVFVPSTAATLSQAVAPAPLTIKADDQIKTYGQTITFAGTEFTTSGLVNGDTVTSVTLTSAGAAPTAAVSGSPYPIIPSNAAGTGLGNYTISYASGNLTINKAGTTTAVVSSVNPSVNGQPVTFTASLGVLAPGAGTPSGTVQFLVDGADSGTPVPLSGGIASFSFSSLPIGSHTISAGYSGDGNFVMSTGTLSQYVDYHFSGFLPPLNSLLAFGANRTVPIKFQLTDYSGNFVTSLSAVSSLQVLNSQGANVLTNTGSTALRYDPASNQFVANWQTKGLPVGSYSVTLALADGTTDTKTLQLTMSSGASGLTTGANGGTGTGSAPGGLLGGDIALYVDNSNGDLTADELARIQDAVTTVDALVQPYGVAVAEVTNSTLADVALDMDATSAVGGYADGVLGCTTDAGQITIITGWNFYGGIDTTQIGAGQYDFETVVMHELGHALGLGHSADAASVMYATLSAGVANRAMTTTDLDVPDSDNGACGLHAAGARTVTTHTAAPVPLAWMPTKKKKPNRTAAASLGLSAEFA